MADAVVLRDVLPGDLEAIFEMMREPESRRMAAFGVADAWDREAFAARWGRILADETIVKRTIEWRGLAVGHLVCWRREGRLEVGYWLARERWGRGLAREALRAFLVLVRERPLCARVAADNLASRAVLERCGFRVEAEMRGFANCRGEEIAELLLTLDGPAAAAASPPR